MAYTKIEWLDHGETNAKPIDKDNLNHMDEGIYNLQNIELIAVTDIEPTTFEEGNKYYNTKENLVYTAENQIWANGETPRSGVFYLVLTDSKNYYYDGTTLISVGGGASNDVIISPEEPTTEDWKIWIDSDEVDNLGSEVVDTLEGNETDTAPSVRAVKETLNGTILYENASGTTTNFTLIEDSSNYKEVEVLYNCNNYGIKSTGRIPIERAKTILLEYIGRAMDTIMQYSTVKLSISGNSGSFSNACLMNVNTSKTISTVNVDEETTTIKVLKVTGYK